MNLHCICIDDLNVDKVSMIWLSFECLFGFNKLNVNKFRLICQHFPSYCRRFDCLVSHNSIFIVSITVNYLEAKLFISIPS